MAKVGCQCSGCLGTDELQRKATEAFDKAVLEGRLSTEAGAPNYAGSYMYMGTTQEGIDAFKHKQTREYLPTIDGKTYVTPEDKFKEVFLRIATERGLHVGVSPSRGWVAGAQNPTQKGPVN